MNAIIQYHEGRFPPQELDWIRLIALDGPANAAVARFDGALSAIPNSKVLLSPLTTQEAVLPSRIEGTQATMGEVLEYEARGDTDDPRSEREADIWEVLNYRKALNTAVAMLEELPLCERLIRKVHQVLLNSVRGHGKSPGEYRRIPNWIGPAGCSMEEAHFVPIAAEKLPGAMKTWERYIHEEIPYRLVQLASLHAEFEALHPFLDGNGRIGRLFIPLFMYCKKLIGGPTLYISAFLEANRDEYCRRLRDVSKEGSWTEWCVFFLEAVRIQAEANLAKTNAILDLYNRMKPIIADLTRSQYSIHATDWIFERPIFKSSDFINETSVPKPTAQRILSVLKNEKILKTLREASGRRAAILAFGELLNIAEGHDVF